MREIEFEHSLGLKPEVHETSQASNDELYGWLSEVSFLQNAGQNMVSDGMEYSWYPNTPAEQTNEEETSMLQTETTSLEIFMKFVKRTPDGDYDVSRILSRECYEAWLESRRAVPKSPEQAFRKSIVARITCSNEGTIPFLPQVEANLIKILRRSEVWPCFRNRINAKNNKPIKIGLKRCSAIGFHERQEKIRLSEKRKLVNENMGADSMKRYRLHEC